MGNRPGELPNKPEQPLWGSFAADSVIVSIPVMALFYRLQNFLFSGLTAGSVTG